MSLQPDDAEVLSFPHTERTRATVCGLCSSSGGPTDTFYLFDDFIGLIMRAQTLKQVHITPFSFPKKFNKILLLGKGWLRGLGPAERPGCQRGLWARLLSVSPFVRKPRETRAKARELCCADT